MILTALFLFLLLAAVILGLIGAVVKGLFYRASFSRSTPPRSAG
ncbi:hypothetical protein SUDANB37_05211 [Streptomyces sp. enrichment culture]